MIGIVMAGGRGTRMNTHDEKLLLCYKKPVILHVVESLQDTNYFSKVLAATSCNSPKTKRLLQENNVETFDTLGEGYAKDLNYILHTINEYVLVVPGDMPLLNGEIIKDIASKFDPQKTWTSILITNEFLASFGLKSEYLVDFDGKKCHYTGISLINSRKINSLDSVDESYIIINDKRIAFNLNSKRDYDLLGTA